MIRLRTRLIAAILGLCVAASALANSASAAPAPDVFFKPDIRVNYLSKTTNGLNVTYAFNISNIGAADADNVHYSVTFARNLVGGSEQVSQTIWGTGGTIASLRSGETVTRHVTCSGKPGNPGVWVCAGATLTGSVSNDLDTSNNSAHSK